MPRHYDEVLAPPKPAGIRPEFATPPPIDLDLFPRTGVLESSQVTVQPHRARDAHLRPQSIPIQPEFEEGRFERLYHEMRGAAGEVGELGAGFGKPLLRFAERVRHLQSPFTISAVDDALWDMGLDPVDVRANPDADFRVGRTGGSGEWFLEQATKIARDSAPASRFEIPGSLLGGMLGDNPITIEQARGPLETLSTAVPFGFLGYLSSAGMAASKVGQIGKGFAPALGRAGGLAPSQVAETGLKTALTRAVQPRLAIQGAQEASVIGENVIGLRPIEIGLTRTEELANVVRRTVGKAFTTIEDNPISTAAMRERARVAPAIESLAGGVGQEVRVLTQRAFILNEKGQIPALFGLDDTLIPALRGQVRQSAPTIADVAARLPTYWSHLDEAQRAAMVQLRDIVAPYGKLLDDVGVGVRTRQDIVDGGFYIPRGRALEEGAEEPIKVFAGTRRGVGKGFEKPAAFESSQAQGIEAGWQYAPMDEAIASYVRDAGKRATDQHVTNFFKTLIDPDTGQLLGKTSADRVPPVLRATRDALKRQIHGRTQTVRRRRARIVPLSREAERAGRGFEAGAGRVERAGERLGSRAAGFDPSDLTQARQDLSQAIADGQEFARKMGDNAQKLRTAKAVLSDTERNLLREVDALNTEVAAAQQQMASEIAEGTARRPVTSGSLSRTVGSYMKAANQITRRVEKLSERAETMSIRVDRLMERGDIFSDMGKAARDDLVEARRTERLMIERDKSLGAIQRELNILEAEERRLARQMQAADIRAGQAVTLLEATRRELQGFQKRLNDLAGTWDHAIRRSKDPPRSEGKIALPGLQQHSFPNALVNAANKVLRAEGGEKSGRFIERADDVYLALNNMYRGINSTWDNSALAIHGLLALFDNQRAYSKALLINARAWFDPIVLGRFLEHFDELAVRNGRMTYKGWAREGLRIGGQETEYQLTGPIMRIPVVGPGARAANRAFGYFGDSLRLAWADEELAGLLRQGRSLEEVKASGDLERIAKGINGTSGWSNVKFAGDIGERTLFASRFFQSRLETVARAGMSFRPGAPIEQRIARRALLKLIGIGTMLTVGINSLNEIPEAGRKVARGDILGAAGLVAGETDFRLIVDGRKNPNFMRIRFAGRDWSLFGTWDSLVGAIISTAMGRPQDALRGMGAGAISMGWDLISGEDFIRRRVRDDPLQFAQFLMRSFSPFATEELPEAGKQFARGEILEGSALAFGEMAGAKSAPVTASETIDDLRRRAMKEEGLPDVDPYDLNLDVLDELDKRPGIQEAIVERDKELATRGGPWGKYRTEKDALQEQYHKNAQTAFAGDEETGEEGLGYGKKLRRQLGSLQHDLQRDLAGLTDRSEDALAFLKERDPSEAKFQIALSIYFEALERDPPLEHYATGEYDFEEREKRLGDLASHPEVGVPMMKRIKMWLREKQPPIVQELQRDRETLSDYWQNIEDLIARKDAKFPGFAQKYDEYRALRGTSAYWAWARSKENISHRKYFVETIPLLNLRWLQENDPTGELERLLRKWDYRTGSSFADTEVGKEAIRKEKQRQELEPAGVAQ